jgi:hypothetical protein
VKVERLKVERLKVERVKVERVKEERLKVERTRRSAPARRLPPWNGGQPLSGPLQMTCRELPRRRPAASTAYCAGPLCAEYWQ